MAQLTLEYQVVLLIIGALAISLITYLVTRKRKVPEIDETPEMAPEPEAPRARAAPTRALSESRLSRQGGYIAAFPAEVRQDLVQSRQLLLEEMMGEGERIQRKLELAGEAIVEDVETIEAFHTKIVGLEQKLDASLREKSELETGLQKINEVLRDKDTEISSLNERLEEVSAYCLKQDQTIEESEQAIDELKQSYQNLADSNADFHGRIQVLDQERSDTLERYAALEDTLATREQMLDDYIRKNSELTQMLTDEKSKGSLAENKLERVAQRLEASRSDFERQIDRLRDERDAALSKLQGSIDTTSALKQQIDVFERESNRLRDQLTSLQADTSKIRGSHARQAESLRIENTDLRAHVAVLERVVRENSLRLPRIQKVRPRPDEVARELNVGAPPPPAAVEERRAAAALAEEARVPQSSQTPPSPSASQSSQPSRTNKQVSVVEIQPHRQKKNRNKQ